ncbi:UbiA family prenyltransferase [Devosia faecipullorum]|uniref:UbiA family prenyltransferase n=1 Tax=Devosia faecipullorum TaxID=2755039 RepID=UPI00187B7AFC|nr:UbiA family prenyltransferase [Devosia faecipullorum]MBE7731949.1 UbiA family prenyltransferase [Devosia faecipullorum]
MDFSILPWRQEVLGQAREAKARGQRIVLVTRGDLDLARRASDHLGLFDDVVRAGGTGEPVGAVPVQVSRPKPTDRLKAAMRAIRPHQWVKNVLVFVPLLVSGEYNNLSAWFYAGLAFIAFSLTASAIYILNDLSDLEADRLHARKRLRPFASGALPVVWGFVMAPVLLGAGIVTALVAGGLPYLLLYAVLSISYSLDLKKRTFFDVFALAALYTVRLFGGGEMSGQSPSVWLLAFSVFLFLGLALMKRMAELVGTTADKLKRRGYKQIDQPLLMSAGIASSFGAALVLALYLDSDAVGLVYVEPVRLWLIVPMMLFWQLKLWHKTLHGRMTDDPIVFAARDRVSWIIGAMTLVCVVLARLSW